MSGPTGTLASVSLGAVHAPVFRTGFGLGGWCRHEVDGRHPTSLDWLAEDRARANVADVLDDAFVAKQIAIGRILFGVLMLFFPRLILRRSAPDASGPAVWIGRIFGIRDIALGAGTLGALQAEEPGAVRWVAVSAAADAADAVTALVWREELGREGVLGTLALAVPAMVGGAKAASGLRS